MAPLEKDDIQQFYGSRGEFTSIRKLLKPGEKCQVELLDLNKNFKTKYPIKDKDYNYRLTFKKDSITYLMDLTGKDTLKQLVDALYPQGAQGGVVPCFATFARRTERKTYEGELVITKGDTITAAPWVEPTPQAPADSNDIPF